MDIFILAFDCADNDACPRFLTAMFDCLYRAEKQQLQNQVEQRKVNG